MEYLLIPKVVAIQSWPTSKSIHNVRSFHELETFYRTFMRGFSSIISLVIDCLKGQVFVGKEQAQSFSLIKEKLSTTLVLALLYIDQAFEVEIGALIIGIMIVISHN